MNTNSSEGELSSSHIHPLCLELQHIIRAQHLFLFDAEVDSGDASVGKVEEFR